MLTPAPFMLLAGVLIILTASADKSAKVWEISEDGNGTVVKTLTCPGSGGVEDMVVGCLWLNDHLIVVSLSGAINLFSASDLEKAPVLLSGHMKNVTALTLLGNEEKTIVTSSYDGHIIRWNQGIGYVGKLERGNSSQIKCLAAAKEEIMTSGFDNKVHRMSLQGNECGTLEAVDVGSQPQDLCLALNTPGLALVATESAAVLMDGVKVMSSTKLDFLASACAIKPDGSEAIVGAQDGKLHVYSVSGDTLTEEAVLEKHRGPVNVIRYSPDVSMFASADLNREAVVWDSSSREVTYIIHPLYV
ncbi:Actin-interacting protein 1-2 [Linum grandiflorum]